MVSNDYSFTRHANDDLDEILSYISFSLANPKAAKDFFDHVFATIDRLCLFPKSCQIVENSHIRRNDVRKAIVDNYNLYYVYESQKCTVFILRIVYGKRNVAEIMKNL